MSLYLISKQQSYYELNCYRLHQGAMRKAEPGEVWDVDPLQEVDLPQWWVVPGKRRLEGGVGVRRSQRPVRLCTSSPPRWDRQEAADGEAGSSRPHSWHLVMDRKSGGRKKDGAQETQSSLQPSSTPGRSVTVSNQWPSKVMAVPSLPLPNSSFGQI